LTLLFNTKKYITVFRFFQSVCYYDLFLVSFVCVFDQLRHSTFSESINLACCRASISYFPRKAMEIKTDRQGSCSNLKARLERGGSLILQRDVNYSQILRTLFTNSSKVVQLESQVLTNFFLEQTFRVPDTVNFMIFLFLRNPQKFYLP
jgi:hypothetical protein